MNPNKLRLIEDLEYLYDREKQLTKDIEYFSSVQQPNESYVDNLDKSLRYAKAQIKLIKQQLDDFEKTRQKKQAYKKRKGLEHCQYTGKLSLLIMITENTVTEIDYEDCYNKRIWEADHKEIGDPIEEELKPRYSWSERIKELDKAIEQSIKENNYQEDQTFSFTCDLGLSYEDDHYGPIIEIINVNTKLLTEEETDKEWIFENDGDELNYVLTKL